MKKKYVKPLIIIEDFQLCESIATVGCELKANQYRDACAYYDEESGMTLFAEPLDVCVQEPADNDEYCYHIPNESWNIFAS